LVLARVIEPVSKLDTIRVLEEIGIMPPSYRTILRRLPGYAADEWRQRLAQACAAHVGLGPATLVIYDVTTLYFEIDEGDGFREPGFSKERRLEPQITVGLLTDVRGFPLMVHAFEGNKAETKTILPVLKAFMAAHRLPEVTVVADAGMLSEANLAAIEDAGLRFIVGARIPEVPYQVAQWRRAHPDQPIADGQIFTQPWVMGTKAGPRRRTIFYQYRADRARRALKGIDQQIVKAEKAIRGEAAIKRNRFVQLTGGSKSVNRDLEAKARALAGLKGYITNLEAPTPEFVMGAYHQLWQIEKSFRMSKSDLRARPIYHHKRDSIEAHLTVVMAALAVSRMVERSTTRSIARFVKTLAATTPSPSRPATRPSPPPTPSPTTHNKRSPASAMPPQDTNWHKSGRARSGVKLHRWSSASRTGSAVRGESRSMTAATRHNIRRRDPEVLTMRAEADTFSSPAVGLRRVRVVPARR
jgi:hypothetical protein